MHAAIKLLWQSAHTRVPQLSQTWLDEQPEELRKILLEQGFLVQTEISANYIKVGGKNHEVFKTLYSDGNVRFFYNEEGRPQNVEPKDLYLYRVCFTPLLKILHDELPCRGNIEELVPGLLWKIGATGQQSREVYLARNWGNDLGVQSMLANIKKSSIVLRLGCKPEKCDLADSQVYDVADLIDWESGSLIFNAKSIHDNLKDMVAARPAKTRTKSVNKLDEHRVKAENLLQCWFRYKYENAKRSCRGDNPLKPTIDLTFTNQKEFAKVLKISETSVTRMKQEVWEKDLLGSGYVYKKMLESLSKTGADFFIDFYNLHKKQLKEIGIEY